MILLGGLPEEITLCSSRTVLAYLLLLLIVFCIPGFTIYHEIKYQKTFRLIRSNIRVWCRWVYRRTAIISVLITGLVTMIQYILYADMTVFFCGLLLILHTVSLNMIQSFCMLCYGKGETGFALVMSIELISIFCSSGLKGNLGLILPGNWGCYNRCNRMVEEGFDILPVVFIELIIIMVLYVCSYKVIREKMLS